MKKLEDKIVNLYKKDIDAFETVKGITETIKEELKIVLEPSFIKGVIYELPRGVFNHTFSSLEEIEREGIFGRFEELKYRRWRKFLFGNNLLKGVKNIIDVGCGNGLFSICCLKRYIPKHIEKIELIDFSEAILVPYILLTLQKFLTDEEIYEIYKDKVLDNIDGFYKRDDLEKILGVLRKYGEKFIFNFTNFEKFYNDKKSEYGSVNSTILFAIRVINNLRFNPYIVHLAHEIETKFLNPFLDLSKEIFIYDLEVRRINFPERIKEAIERLSEKRLDFGYKAEIVEYPRNEIYLYAF